MLTVYTSYLITNSGLQFSLSCFFAGFANKYNIVINGLTSSGLTTSPNFHWGYLQRNRTALMNLDLPLASLLSRFGDLRQCERALSTGGFARTPRH